MFSHPIFTQRFWLIALSLVAFVSQPLEAAFTKPGELETLWLPTDREEGSVIKVEKYLPDTVKANEAITYTIKVTNKTADRILLDVIVYEILPSSEDFEYTGATPRPIISEPVPFKDLNRPGGSPLNSRILTFRWDDDRIFYPGEERTIAVTGIVKKNSGDLKTLLAPRFCTAANYVTGFCKGVTTAELKLIKQFIYDGRVVPEGGSVPKYPKVCGRVMSATEKVPACLMREDCLNCEPRNPERCTFDVKYVAQNTGTTAISDIRLTDELADPLLIHKTGKGKIDEPLSPITLQPGSTSHPVTHQVRAECSADDIGTSAQAESANPALTAVSNTPKIKITSSKLELSAEAPALETGSRVIRWAIRADNKGERAAQNVEVIAKFSSSRDVSYTLSNDTGTRSGSNIFWKLPQLDAFDSRTFNVAQVLSEAKGFAAVDVTAVSDCDCASAEGTASSINYAMVVEMIDLNDPFRPKMDVENIRYRLTVCNQVRNEQSAFDFDFSGGLYGPYPSSDSPAQSAVNSYSVKFNKIARLNDDEEVEGSVPLGSHYQGVTQEGTFGNDWESSRKFRFGALLKGRHCAKFDIGVQVNDNLTNGKHSLHINVQALDLPIPVPLEARETEPTTVER